MHEIVSAYAKLNGLELPDDYAQIAELMFLSDIPHFILDVRGIGKHPFLNTQYQLINPKHIHSDALGDYAFAPMITLAGQNVFTSINDLYSQAIKEQFGLEKTMVVGIANKHGGERDIALFYVFDDAGKSQGLHSCVFEAISTHGKPELGESIRDMFSYTRTG